jgi:hypothetical protein
VKRSVAVVVGIALAVCVALGAVAFFEWGTSTAGAGQAASDLHVVWSGGTADQKGLPGIHLESGSVQGDPGHGFVIVEVPGQKPAFYSAPAGTGAFQLATDPGKFSSTWVFRAADGSLLLVDPGRGMAIGTIFTYLGKPLDPAKLGAIGSRGVAVPVAWGPYTHNGRFQTHAVALVEQLDRSPGWQLDGYVRGFSLPQGLPPQQALQRPLLGSDGHLYSIDAKGQRLVRMSATGSSTTKYPHFGCTSWPAPDGGSYAACPDSIVLHKADGSAVTLLRRHLPGLNSAHPERGWYFVQASPNRKWLLLEDAFGACGTATWAEFQQGNGGPLVSAFPDAESSQALGWLPDNTALVGVQTNECDGAPTGGIYQVTPGNWVLWPQLVFPTATQDATTWGFGR